MTQFWMILLFSYAENVFIVEIGLRPIPQLSSAARRRYSTSTRGTDIFRAQENNKIIHCGHERELFWVFTHFLQWTKTMLLCMWGFVTIIIRKLRLWYTTTTLKNITLGSPHFYCFKKRKKTEFLEEKTTQRATQALWSFCKELVTIYY